MLRCRASLTYPLSGSPGVITIYARTAVVEDSARATLLSTRLQNAMTAAYALFPLSFAAVSDGYVDQLDPATGALTGSFSTTQWTVQGGNGSGYLPPATAVAVTWVTADYVAGRRVRGRTYLGPLSSAINNGDGHLIGADYAVVQDFIDAWLDNGAEDVYPVVWHRPVGGSGGSIHDITAGTAKDKFAVLRSRRD